MYGNKLKQWYLVTSDGWVHCLFGISDPWALDPNAGFPVPSWMGNVIGLGQGTRLALLFGNDDKFYNLELHDQGSGTLEVMVGVITDSYVSGPTLNTYTGGYGLSQYYLQAATSHSGVVHGNRMAILRDGYVTSSMDAGGAIVYQWSAKDLSFLGDAVFDNDSPIYKELHGSKLFWREGNTIKAAHVVDDVAVTELVTDDDMIGWWTVGDTVMFTAYITFLDVGTYKVNTDLSVELVETSEMHLIEIVEFAQP